MEWVGELLLEKQTVIGKRLNVARVGSGCFGWGKKLER